MLTAVSTLAIVAALVGGTVWCKIGSAKKTLVPLETGRLTDDVVVVKDDIANVFFVCDSLAGWVAIDAGKSLEGVAGGMRSLGIDPAEVSAVLLTHTDGDHVGALGLFEGAALYMAREEVQMTDGRTAKKFGVMRNLLPRTNYILLDDRQAVNVGGLKVEGILAPGHTTGMMAFLVNDRYLFSGDVTALKDGRMAPVPAIYNMDTRQATGSMELLRGLPDARYIFTSHWGWSDYRTAVEYVL